MGRRRNKRSMGFDPGIGSLKRKPFRDSTRIGAKKNLPRSHFFLAPQTRTICGRLGLANYTQKQQPGKCSDIIILDLGVCIGSGDQNYSKRP